MAVIPARLLRCSPRFWARRRKSDGRKWRVRCEGSGGAPGQGPDTAARDPRRGSVLVLRESFELAALSPRSPSRVICYIPVKKWKKSPSFKEGVHLPWPSNSAGFGPTAHIHQPGRVKGGFWFIKCSTENFVHGGRCCYPCPELRADF